VGVLMKIKAICFDLGDTLICSENQLNWANNYKNALEKGFKSINKEPTEDEYNNCIEILKKYNTRINPREYEISSGQIFNEIMKLMRLNLKEKNQIEEYFFDYFMKKNKAFDDTEEVLEDIKKNNLKTGILTDVPYGSIKVVIDDINKIKNNKIIDVILSSVEVGYRKPNKNGYIMLSKKLGVQTNEIIYIGNEEKDIIGANNAGIISILINRKDEEINYGEKYQFKSLRDMWHFVKKLTCE
jgi:putative hydrolase of the HAD superfamily